MTAAAVRRRTAPVEYGVLAVPLSLYAPCASCGAVPSSTTTHTKRPPAGARAKPLELALSIAHEWWCPDGPVTEVDLSAYVVRSQPHHQAA